MAHKTGQREWQTGDRGDYDGKLNEALEIFRNSESPDMNQRILLAKEEPNSSCV
jgi:hypothetical protein